ncbi:hypothetical protein C1H46_040299 [Malus baccata]|uniref:Uncharacterized protein n=1 Tax=Malus baccata TaxID=106549 RepID=A0A540KJH1_MALBA|nr:hypothetical protein C1H46_040299 [Malus baccata]
MHHHPSKYRRSSQPKPYKWWKRKLQPSSIKHQMDLSHRLNETTGKENPLVTIPIKAYTWKVVVCPSKPELYPPSERFAMSRVKKNGLQIQNCERSRKDKARWGGKDGE